MISTLIVGLILVLGVSLWVIYLMADTLKFTLIDDAEFVKPSARISNMKKHRNSRKGIKS